MRGIIVASIAAFGLVAGVAGAQAAPVALHDTLLAAQADAIIQVRDGCGPGWFRETWQNRWGQWRSRCVPYRRW